MPLLNLRRFRKNEQKPETKPALKPAPTVPASRRIAVKDASPARSTAPKKDEGVLVPRVSEKATALRAQHCYVFNIPRAANKQMVAQAVLAAYKKEPVAVRTVNFPKKSIIARGKRGTTGGGKKAYVFLKKGDTIEV